MPRFGITTGNIASDATVADVGTIGRSSSERMRYLPYILIGYLALGLQCGLGPFIRWNGAAPNLVLLAVVYIAINAPRQSALLGCFVAGLFHDMVSMNPLGTYALAYGLAALALTSLAAMLPREKVGTFMILSAVGLLIVQFILLLSGWFFPPGLASKLDTGVDLPAVAVPFSVLFFEGIYTLALSPLAFIPMRKIGKWFDLNALPKGFSSRG